MSCDQLLRPAVEAALQVAREGATADPPVPVPPRLRPVLNFSRLNAKALAVVRWRTSTEGIVEYEKLPRQAHEYLAFVEKESGAKIGMISTGP